ncbi:hypothetical protein N9A67_06930 [Rhodobacteraceae bacterium]|nr:hypothetical protein [Paracoccaceae bacterium]
MSTQCERKFSAKGVFEKKHDYTVKVDSEAFSQSSSNNSIKKAKNDRKFNIRVKQHDILLLDLLAAHAGVPRSVLINKFLHDFLLDELMSIKEDDARLLLAAHADRDVIYDEFEKPWMYSAFNWKLMRILKNVSFYNEFSLHVQPPDVDPAGPEFQHNSETFRGLRSKLKGVKK